MNKNEIISVVIAFLISFIILFIGNNPNLTKYLGITTNNAPKELYHVYLSGKSLGIIKSKEELENYIDSKQEQLKQQYNVDKVYAPNDLDIVKELTYNEQLISVENIYKKIEKIKGSSSFTIDGYKIEINGLEKTNEESGETYKTEDLVIYVIDKNIFTDAVDKVVSSFVNTDMYSAYLNDTQIELKENETGTIIENIYIKNNVIVKQQRIPTGEKIYKDVSELTQFLLFGTTEKQETYVVKAGDTIEEISENNKLSTEEFLIANTNYKTAQDLLYPGAVVKISLINPQLDIVEEQHVVSKKVLPKEVTFENDDTQYVGYEKIKEDGLDGLALVTEKIQLVNGKIVEDIPTSTIELIPVINKIIVRGSKQKPQTAYLGNDTVVPVDIGTWVWPTNIPYTISSKYGWRWGTLHDGVDISGTGYGSSIKAANNGIIIRSSYDDYNGNYIIIKHSNGYFTYYGHMAKRYKQIGTVVMGGDVIGTMGMTGFATGVHLHFGVYTDRPWGKSINPLNIY